MRIQNRVINIFTLVTLVSLAILPQVNASSLYSDSKKFQYSRNVLISNSYNKYDYNRSHVFGYHNHYYKPRLNYYKPHHKYQKRYKFYKNKKHYNYKNQNRPYKLKPHFYKHNRYKKYYGFGRSHGFRYRSQIK